jgi:hypothetical protein
MFRATMCPSSGETIVFMRHLVLVILSGWLSGMHPAYQTVIHRITSTKCCINTIVSPDDGHIVARNMWRLINILRINILRINCSPIWLYLQHCTGFTKMAWVRVWDFLCCIVLSLLLSCLALPCANTDINMDQESLHMSKNIPLLIGAGQGLRNSCTPWNNIFWCAIFQTPTAVLLKGLLERHGVSTSKQLRGFRKTVVSYSSLQTPEDEGSTVL